MVRESTKSAEETHRNSIEEDKKKWIMEYKKILLTESPMICISINKTDRSSDSTMDEMRKSKIPSAFLF